MPFASDRYRRRSIRLPGYDYTRAGAYYVTICAAARGSMFGRKIGGSIDLNALGRIARDAWYALPEHFPHVMLDAFVIMPDHVHGVIVFIGGTTNGDGGDDVGAPPGHASIDGDGGDGGDDVGAQHAAPLRNAPLRYPPSTPHVAPRSLGAVVRSFKSAATRAINLHRNTPGVLVWQRNYYDHIVRDEADLVRIRQYIAANPARWLG